MAEKLLRIRQVLELVPIGRSTWWLWVGQGRAPAGLKLSEGVTVWRQSDIDRFLSELK